jgi:hypothetical protein
MKPSRTDLARQQARPMCFRGVRVQSTRPRAHQHSVRARSRRPCASTCTAALYISHSLLTLRMYLVCAAVRLQRNV